MRPWRATEPEKTPYVRPEGRTLLRRAMCQTLSLWHEKPLDFLTKRSMHWLRARGRAENGMSSRGTVESAWAKLEQSDLSSLRRRWADLYGTRPSPRISRDILIGAISYKLQERIFGGLAKGHKRRMARHAKDVALEGKVRDMRTVRLAPGMTLIREWRGRQEEVEVIAGGFIWAGQKFRSLSAVARAITGTGWSGPAFFGLQKPYKKRTGAGPPQQDSDEENRVG